MQEFFIDIAANGDVKVEGVGISGPDCKLLTAEIEKALGDVTSVVKKAEFHQPRQVLRKVGA